MYGPIQLSLFEDKIINQKSKFNPTKIKQILQLIKQLIINLKNKKNKQLIKMKPATGKRFKKNKSGYYLS